MLFHTDNSKFRTIGILCNLFCLTSASAFSPTATNIMPCLTLFYNTQSSLRIIKTTKNNKIYESDLRLFVSFFSPLGYILLE